MCGRYALYGPISRLRRQFGVDDIEWDDSWNIPPGRPVVLFQFEAGRRVGRLVRWGLRGTGQVANVRDDSVVEKPWARALLKSRCVIPMSGFYEWRKPADGTRKQPYYIAPAGTDYLAAAGAIAHWDDVGATMFTTGPNGVMEPIHNRMPVLLDAAGVDAWLDPGTPQGAVIELLRPAPDDALAAWPVGTAVNRVSPETDSDALIRCVEP